MSEDAAAIAALNQTLRQLVGELAVLNSLLDKYGFPTKEELDGTGEGHRS